MNKGKKILLGAALLGALTLGALTGIGVPFASNSGAGIPAAHADGCDTNPPNPALDCPPTSTPTSTPTVTPTPDNS